MRREFLKSASAFAALGLLGRVAGAQASYPAKPITIVFPYGAGGAVATMARAVALHLQGRLGTPVIVEFKPGAATAIGTEFVAKAAPDGYTLLWTSGSTMTTNPVLYKGLRYKPEQFEPITSVFHGALGLCVRSNIPATNFREWVDWAKKNGGKLEYGAAGAGTSPHLLMTSAGRQVGLQPTLISYKGEPPAVADIIGGHLPAFCGALPNMVQHHQARTLRVIAVSSAKRLAAYPDMPTFGEAGFPELEYLFWHGVFAPVGTPPPVIDLVRAGIHEAMATPAVKALLSPDQNVMVGSGEDLRKLIARDTQKWGAVIRENNIVPE